ncbi:MAG TPA: hypothetical protein VMW20_03135 [Candidatus Nanoarchaeia archaeon]|nr:hypothetical protein [Candidatus Nanoarchaeia archaeon]
MKVKQKDNISKSYLISVVVLGMILSTGIVVAADETISISITPAILNLAQTEAQFVFVHTEISYDSVNTDPGSLTLEADDPTVIATAIKTESDTLGNLVVMFDRADVAGIVYVGEVTLTLTGEMDNEKPFTGSDTIRVVDN